MDVAANAAQARASRARQVPDLVLLDIWMPDVDGITLLREWSAAATDGCPVVMMSGHGTVETAVEATRLGAFDFVEKPLSLAKLLRTVERALDAGKRHRQSGKLLGAAARGAGRQEPPDAAAAHRAAADRRQPLAGAADRRARLRPRGLRALPARARPARRARRSSRWSPAACARRMPRAVLFGTRGRRAGRIRACSRRPPTARCSSTRSRICRRARSALLVGVLESGQLHARRRRASRCSSARALLSSAQPGIEQRAGAEALRRDLLAHLNMLIVRVPPLRDYAEDVPELLRH